MMCAHEQVNSPNEARPYGTGEVIVINVVFNQDVVLDGEPTLMLETGVFNQEVCTAETSCPCHAGYLPQRQGRRQGYS